MTAAGIWGPPFRDQPAYGEPNAGPGAHPDLRVKQRTAAHAQSDRMTRCSAHVARRQPGKNLTRQPSVEAEVRDQGLTANRQPVIGGRRQNRRPEDSAWGRHLSR
ncbi:hypothetical protein Aca07nite_25900 [Actinoplanes capillaceus]|uniref:Uncharacterized protein n=1 Tax=Actinoplanes campanulatus TaxID=113559 RepID=A0ABQ3WFE3_9ACTN|nr:hypothetical protein Aca07nite_25900 [Actinoplanes capillaceus]